MAVGQLDESQRNRPLGLFFGSIHGTLNHLLVTDRMWLGRLTGVNPENGPLDKILFEDLGELAMARITEDERLIATVNSYAESDFNQEVTYRNTTGREFKERLGAIFAHLFNHQTHHRGQAHSGLSIVTGSEPEALDLVMFQRGLEAPSVDAVIVACSARQRKPPS